MTQFQFPRTPIDDAKYARGEYEPGRVRLLESLIPDGVGRKAIDLGCGSGYFCQVLNRKEWSVLAVDTAPENIANAGRFAVEARVGDAGRVLSDLPDGEASLVLALELIEHMPKPYGQALLREIRRVLEPGGGLLLSTPNRHSPEGLSGYYWGEKLRGWGRWMAGDPTHVHIYTSAEIVRLLRECGFAVERQIGYWYEGLLPLSGRWRLPLASSSRFPFNRIGYNLMLKCRRA